MTYATRQQMIDAFGQAELVELTDRALPATGAIVDPVLERALAAADAVIDGWLAARYATPVSPAPALLVEIACDLARHRLYGNVVPEAVKDRFNAALTQLRDLAGGRAALPGVAPKASGASGGAAQIVSGGRVFGRDPGSTPW
jgi:phage gp36-like protein